jgi:hypothetical protein
MKTMKKYVDFTNTIKESINYNFLDMYLNDSFIKTYNYENDENISMDVLKKAIAELKTKLDIKNNKITLYRCIFLENINQLDVNDIGRSWSFAENTVSYHYYSFPVEDPNKKPFIIKSYVNLSDVNWETTLILWLMFFDLNRENEITIMENTNLNEIFYKEENSTEDYKRLLGFFNVGKKPV